MTLLEQHFDMAIETPDGIKKLREMILTLAMQGKLVPQDPNDTTASELLKEIATEKKRLIKEGKIKEPKPLPPIKVTEIPYELPVGWEWCRLEDVSNISMGQSPKGKTYNILGEGVPLVNGPVEFGGKNPFAETLSIKYTTAPTKMCKKGDLLLCVRGSTTGRTNIAGFDSCIGRGVAALSPYISNMYFNYFILSQRQGLYNAGTGSTFPNISYAKIGGFLFSLPPMREQNRIVKKTDQLMALCDTLEAERGERNKNRLKLHTAIMDRLFSASDPTQFNHSWNFVTRHFDDIYSVPENVEDLKKAILQLAVMGKLVLQDPNDPPANELLKEIDAEKKRLIKEGKTKEPKPLPPIKVDEIPYELPVGWEWCYLNDAIELISGQHIVANDYNNDKNGVPYLTGPSDFGTINPQFTRWTTSPKVLAQKNDILITVKGSGVGKLNVLNIDEATIGRQIMAIRSDHLNKQYLYYFLINNYEFFQNLKSGIAIPGIGRKDILGKKISLPPLNEQKRIVKKIDQLMELCNSLELQLKESTNRQTSILNAVLMEL